MIDETTGIIYHSVYNPPEEKDKKLMERLKPVTEPTNEDLKNEVKSYFFDIIDIKDFIELFRNTYDVVDLKDKNEEAKNLIDDVLANIIDEHENKILSSLNTNNINRHQFSSNEITSPRGKQSSNTLPLISKMPIKSHHRIMPKRMRTMWHPLIKIIILIRMKTLIIKIIIQIIIIRLKIRVGIIKIIVRI